MIDHVIKLYTDTEYCARQAGLEYVSAEAPGWTRQVQGTGFSYQDARGNTAQGKTRAWIESLAIPPAWKDVWISKNEKAHILATGQDDAGRKQYLYHPKWREFRDHLNHYRLIPFGQSLPKIRRYVSRVIGQDELSRELLIAAVIGLIDKTHIRIGNRQYLEANDSYGATTLSNDNVAVSADKITLDFVGKSGKAHEVVLTSKPLMRVIRQLNDEEGSFLFSYFDDDGEEQSVTSSDVNVALQEIAGFRITAKDFRTWAGTVVAFKTALREEKKDAKLSLQDIYQAVADELGNTVAMARDHYIHKDLLEVIRKQELAELVDAAKPLEIAGLTLSENQLLAVLIQLQEGVEFI
ncbi:DNA topoisomerase IB [Candidatus Woesebacteria bacterium]|nr:DNA topoisomerase IB [Candidatus Woesebacteria bacterium]MCD8507488.1 DNA topoisomerase IB [Candidatus Woesebacteria bacterium]MCD8526943.1 DNA topoisomerase IB [Candidatus Woesebacteria bacterium]MCD8545842.1 DNA topoisomerase IB [Candidatus Woesebacteria bacterium]